MNLEKILNACDHTLLVQTATWEEIRALCDDGIKYHTASVCIPPCYVQKAKEYVGGKLKICTVIGFPNGNMTTDAKVFETRDAVEKGADEIDMVINIGMLRAGEDGYVLDEIKAAGGISSLEDAEKFLALGASRLGTSRIVKIAKTLETK